jgi:protein disulfide-isomerase-like protein
MKSFSVALLALVASTNAIELTPSNYDEAVAGKTVFLKFFAPWCGHCKKLKPDWDKLMDAFADSTTGLVADVDCTTEGKALCDANGVKGYPTLKWGDPSALEDYKGGRDFESLKKFAEENLKPICSPANIDLCDAEKKAEIEKFQAMSAADLEAAISEKEKLMEKAEEDFKTGVSDLQATYQKLMETKDKTLEEIKNSGLGLMKAVKASMGKKGSDEL